MLAPRCLDVVPVGLDDEVLRIEDKLEMTPFFDSFELISRLGFRVNDLGKLLLRHRPDIFHLSAHGSPYDGIVVMDNDGFGTNIGVDVLARLLRNLKYNMRLVFLNVCDSKAYAEAIAQDIDFVIGMERTIETEAAIDFASSFYQALGFGQSVKQAFEAGIDQLSISFPTQSEVPVPLVRQGANDCEPFLNQKEHKQILESLKCTDILRLQPTRSPFSEPEIHTEFVKEAARKLADKGRELWRFQSEDGVLNALLILESNGDLKFHLWSTEPDLEGSRFRFQMGPVTREILIKRVSESEFGATLVVDFRERPKNLADISVEAI